MENQRAVVPVGVVRERVIQTLTDAFANDLITVAELEDRLEKAYRAASAEEAMALIAGLPTTPQAAALAGTGGLPAAPPPADLTRRPERFRSFMSSQSRRGVWTVPRDLEVQCIFSDTTIDLTHASLPQDIVEIDVSVIFANLQIVIPPGIRVVNRVGAFAANVESEPALDLAPMKPGAPVIRISGNAAFANVEIVSGFKPKD